MRVRSFSPRGVTRPPKSKITKNLICWPVVIRVWHLLNETLAGDLQGKSTVAWCR